MTATTWTINDIKAAVRATGSHWFDPDTMRFFGTRVSETVYQGSGGVYFVTSEKPPHGPRQCTVRRFNPDTADIATGRRSTIRTGNHFRTLRSAASRLNGSPSTWARRASNSQATRAAVRSS